MLQIDSLLLEAFYTENKDFFTNARVQKIQQPTRREIILQLRNNGETKKLYININPNFYHICFMNKDNEAARNIQIPKQPPMFCMLLRKHMEGARILKINMPENERIIELIFENYNELGDRIEECLAIELMGKHSNIVLYNTDNNIILGCAHNIGAEKSKERELSGGLPYIYPPKQNKKKLLKTRFEQFQSAIYKSNEPIKKAVSEKYFSLSQALVEEICLLKKINPMQVASKLPLEELQILFIELHEFLSNKNRKYSVSDDYSKYSCFENLGKKYENINSLIDYYFAFNIEQNNIKNLKVVLTTKINKELKKQINNYNNQQKQINKQEKAKIYLIKGNLLTANSYKIKAGEKSIQLKDFDTNETVDIELDENLSVIENAQRYFSLYNKTKKSCQIAQEMAIKTQEEINYLKQILYDIEECKKLEELNEIALETAPEKEIQKPKNKKEETINIYKEIIDGFTIYVGKNNKQNDYLYSKISSGNDIWLHTLNTTGSHVIIKTQNSSVPLKEETILKAAKLAKKYSSAKNSTKIPVVYTLRKYIKRPNKTKSGFVVYKNETEIVVD